jgi:hypothetical protein
LAKRVYITRIMSWVSVGLRRHLLEVAADAREEVAHRLAHALGEQLRSMRSRVRTTVRRSDSRPITS